MSFTDFLLPRKKLTALQGPGEEVNPSEGFNFLDYIKESQSTSQSTKLQSSVTSQEFKVSTNSQLDSQEQSLMEFVQNYDWDHSQHPKTQLSSGKPKEKESLFKQNSVKLSIRVKGEKKSKRRDKTGSEEALRLKGGANARTKQTVSKNPPKIEGVSSLKKKDPAKIKKGTKLQEKQKQPKKKAEGKTGDLSQRKHDFCEQMRALTNININLSNDHIQKSIAEELQQIKFGGLE